jgi:deazaflavin-dependent oxidoreductase (nitroreductase family)
MEVQMPGTDRKRRVVTRFQKYLLNPVAKLVAGTFPGWVLLETTGRRSGKPRRTPLGGTHEVRDGRETFWVISEQGSKSDYVRNLAQDPHVRVRIRRRWRTGRATILPDDDARARARNQSAWNRTAVQLVGTELLTIRIDLDP